MKCPRCEARLFVHHRHTRKGKNEGKLPGVVRKYRCKQCGGTLRTLEISVQKADLLTRIFTNVYPHVKSIFTTE